MKKKGLWVRTIIILAITLFGIYLVFGPRRTPTSADFTWSGIKANLASNIKLGLDLRGGSHLVMRVKTDDYLKTLTENNAQAALNAAQEARLPVTGNAVTAENGNYSVSLNLSDASQAQPVIDAVKQKVDFVNWNESNNGSTVSWTLGAATQDLLKRQAVDQALKIIDSRINAFGVKEPTLQKYGAETSGQILLQMPGEDDPERIKNLIGDDSVLSLVKIVSPPSPQDVTTYPTKEAALATIGGKETGTQKVLQFTERDSSTTAQNQPPKETRFVVVEYPPVVDGSEIREANPIQQTANSPDYQISFSLKPGGATKFGDWTGRNINNYMGVVLNDQVKSIAYIRERISDSGQISGKFTKNQADDLSLTLKSGALPAKIIYQEERTVGPSLGADSIESGVEASLGGMVFIIAFMLFYYRGAGINAVVALLLNFLLTLAALITIKSTLTLPGIAGLILGIGMAVDSNVLIFERIREELRAGRSVPDAIGLGFDRAFVTIIDTHVTTILSSAILYLYGTGPIRGFAVTLVLGLLINLFSAVFVSRTIFMWMLMRNPKMEKLSI